MCSVFSFKLLCIIVIFTLVESKSNLHVRITRAKGAKAASTTAKPGATKATTVAPGGKTTKATGVTTAKPGAGGATTSAKPGAGNGTATTAKPGGKPTTTKPGKPGGKPTTAKPGGGGTGPVVNPDNGTVVPPGVMEPPEVPTHTLLGFGAGKYFWLANDKTNKDEADKGCDDILQYYKDNGLAPFNNWQIKLASGADDSEKRQIVKLTATSGESTAWIGVIVQNEPDGRSLMIKSTGSGIMMEDAKRRKREGRSLISHAERSVGIKRKRQVDDEGKGTSITVRETHYPWLAAWNNEGGCRDIRGCEPIVCNVTTPPCKIYTPGCQIGNNTHCGQISSGNCSVVCEKCVLTANAECWMGDSKCEVTKERECSLSAPDCTISNEPCVVSRPPCVTKQAPCSVNSNNTTVNETVCETMPPCGTPQGVTCVTSPRPCTEDEIDEGITDCSLRTCTANPLCIKPEYCRKGGNGMITVDCPAPITFCPPEVINCPPPKVECNEPELTCSDPEIYCPPPQVVCTQPQVSCSAPSVSCPTVIAECNNPDLECAPPNVECEPAKLECNQPTPCLIKPPEGEKMCPVKCEGDCKCMIYSKSGDTWNQTPENCDASHRGLCAGFARSGS